MKFNPKALPITSRALFTIVGGAVLINPVFAQEQAGEELEEVVVTGLRGSLKASMEIKRDAIGVVDAITAEDIGKFPDTNLAESLQRIPGVSIDRQNGEGSQVTVRGFGPAFNLVTLNGRTVPTAEVNIYGAPELVFGPARAAASTSRTSLRKRCRRLEVYKTGQALLPSGGIGATINVKTRRPFDTPGMQGVFRRQGAVPTPAMKQAVTSPPRSAASSTGRMTAKLSASVFSVNTPSVIPALRWARRTAGMSALADDIMNNGAVVKASADPANFVNMPPDGALYAIPDDSRYDVSDLTSERMNAQAVLQFRPADSMTMTLDYTYFQNTTTEMRMEQTNWFNTPFDHLTFETDDEGEFYHAVYLQESQQRREGHGLRADQ